MGLFIFDNAPSHQKRADDALSAQQMVKGAWFTLLSSQFLIFFSPEEGLGTPFRQ